MLADRRAVAVHERLLGAVAGGAQPPGASSPNAAVPVRRPLRKAMAQETELFFESQVREDRPIQELLRANYTFLNEQLARHYGINDIYGSHFRRVTLTDERRHGLLGHAQRPDGDVVRRPDLGRAARQVGAREPARRAAAAAAAQRAAAQGERRAQQADGAARADGAAPQQRRSARAATRGWIRSASRSSTSTRSARGARPTAAPRSTRRSRCTATTIDSPKAFREALLTQTRRVRRGRCPRSC